MPRAAQSDRSTRPLSGWRNALRCATAAWIAWAAGNAAWASPDATLAPTAAVECMTPAQGDRGRPVYPDEPLRLKQGSRVRVELVFESPDSAPEVKFLDDQHFDAFEAPVKDYVRKLRVPCMAAGAAPVRLRQEFVFEPNDGRKVVYSAVSDARDTARRTQLSCTLMPKGDDAKIDYPSGALHSNRQGIVVVRARFVDPAAPPETEVLDDAGSRYFAEAVLPYVARMRMPCLQGEPVDLHMFFQFVIDGASGTRHVLKDLDLVSYLRLAKPTGGVYFDTTTMDCPFDVRLKFRQPFEPNAILELETEVPIRHAFLDWLASLPLSVEPRVAKELFGQESVIHVPCTRINL